MVDIPELIVWILVGMIAGDIVARIVTGKKEGYGWFKNLGLGLAGGLVGGFLFIKLIKLDFGMSEIAISLQQVVAAALGALLVLLLVRALGKKKKAAAPKA